MCAAADDDFVVGVDLTSVDQLNARGDFVIFDDDASDGSPCKDFDACEVEDFAGMLSAAIFPVFRPWRDTKSFSGVEIRDVSKASLKESLMNWLP